MSGFQVVDAGSAEEALLRLKDIGVLDLLFTDIRLPGMDGWSLASHVRALKPDAPVIYASGNAERQELLPRSEFIQKPYRTEQIFAVAAGLGVASGALPYSRCPRKTAAEPGLCKGRGSLPLARPAGGSVRGDMPICSM